MDRPERFVLAIGCLAAGPFLTYFLLPAVGSIGLSALPLVPLAALGPTALGAFACVAVLRGGKPRAADAPADVDGTASYPRSPPLGWDGDAAPEVPRAASRAWLFTVPLLIVLVLLALGGCLLCLGPFGPG
jgi:hypothetical protein